MQLYSRSDTLSPGAEKAEALFPHPAPIHRGSTADVANLDYWDPDNLPFPPQLSLLGSTLEGKMRRTQDTIC